MAVLNFAGCAVEADLEAAAGETDDALAPGAVVEGDLWLS